MLKPFDFCIALPALAAVVASFFFAYSGQDGEASVFLKNNGGEWVYPVNANETVNVTGPLGTTVVEISDGAARIISSPCANKTCIASGAVRSTGQWAACLPNSVMLYIGAGETDNGIDAAVW